MIYVFKHPDKELWVETSQRMTDKHVYFDNDGLEWQRCWGVPQLVTLMGADVDSANQFVRKTSGWSTGEMWDYSKELSEKRKDKRGYDQVEKAYDAKKERQAADKKNSRKSAS